MILFFSAVLVGLVLTAAVRYICLRWQILDVPNTRSGHGEPTPTLGGVALIVGFWVVVGLHLVLDMPLPDHIRGLLWASLILCFLIRDEFREMGRLQKLGVQVLAAFAMFWGGVVLESITLGSHVYEFGVFGVVVTVFVLVLLQNLYNFMDGLDGFAASEGVLVSGALVAVFWTQAPSLATLFLGVCGVTLGFWIWNKPSARIFLGDVGAHFLPLCFAMGGIQSESMGIVPFEIVILPLGAFLFDSIYTLLRRLMRGENITIAHRFHLYQRLQFLGWTPWAINGIYALCTVLFSGCVLFWHFDWGVVGDTFLGMAMVLIGLGTIYVEQRFAMVDRSEQ
ncbi:MAG: hypothetical protein HOE48_15365 [Candidatus Latescibacteria bacterium]|nr:hypothetical protein [Candidatus Latescibacterota bacterium]